MAKWIIDPAHSEVHFKVKHLVISTVTGSFKRFDCEVESNKEDFSDAKIKFSADIDSIDTRQEQRDTHLKSADFFDAANFPKLTITSTEVIKKSETDYILKGDLTIRGTTKPVELIVEYGGTAVDTYGQTKAGFEITGKINRYDFGLKWSAVTEAGGLVVGDDVKLVVNIQVIKQA
jgi:polyisoprenoid-binding protein YceI